MKKSSKYLYASILVVVVNASGIASVLASPSDVVCLDTSDCEKKWALAERWVSDNSQWRIKTRTDSLIETEKQRQRNYDSLYYKIRKETRDGQSVIRFHAGCLPSVKCSPSIESAQESFRAFLTK